ncbi:echinoderm microtubule-associated protein-like CG42247 isoform X2 [Branchiostoma floridae x Branchiostoma japonicum]
MHRQDALRAFRRPSDSDDSGISAKILVPPGRRHSATLVKDALLPEAAFQKLQVRRYSLEETDIKADSRRRHSSTNTKGALISETPSDNIQVRRLSLGEGQRPEMYTIKDINITIGDEKFKINTEDLTSTEQKDLEISTKMKMAKVDSSGVIQDSRVQSMRDSGIDIRAESEDSLPNSGDDSKMEIEVGKIKHELVPITSPEEGHNGPQAPTHKDNITIPIEIRVPGGEGRQSKSAPPARDEPALPGGLSPRSRIPVPVQTADMSRENRADVLNRAERLLRAQESMAPTQNKQHASLPKAPENNSLHIARVEHPPYIPPILPPSKPAYPESRQTVTTNNLNSESDFSDDDDDLTTARSVLDSRQPLNQPRRARRVTFYRNGDPHWKGVNFAINNKRIRNMEALLILLSEKIPLPYGVRHVYTLGGKRLTDLTELEHGKSYVCASGEMVKGVDYGRKTERYWHNRKPTAGKRRGENYLYKEDPVDRLSIDSRQSMMSDQLSPRSKPRVITIISNTHRDSRGKILLNPRTSQNFEDILKDMTGAIKMTNPPIEALYTFSTEQKVQGFGQLFREFRDCDIFIACGSESLKRGPPSSEGYKSDAPAHAQYEHTQPIKQSTRKTQTPQKQQMSGSSSDSGEDSLTPPPPSHAYISRRRSVQSNATQTDIEADPKPLDDFADNSMDTLAVQDSDDPYVTSPVASEDDVVRMTIHGRRQTFFRPTSYDKTYVNPGSRPNKKLKLEWVYGYRGYDARDNLCVLPSGELMYFVATVVVIYNPRKETQRHYIGHTEDIQCMSHHPSEQYVATGQMAGQLPDAHAHIRVWDHVTLNTLAVIGLETFQNGICCLGFSKQNHGNYLMAVDEGDNHVLSVWDWQADKIVAKTKTHPDTVVLGAFHPHEDSILITAGKQHMYFWKMVGGKILRDKKSGVFEGEKPKFITGMEFSATGDVITGDSSGNILVWSRDDSNIFNLQHAIMRAHEKSVFTLRMLSDGTLLSGGGVDRKLVAWDSLRGYIPAKAERQLSEANGGIRTIVEQNAGQADGLLYLATSNNLIIQGSLQTKFTTVIQGHSEELWALAVHPHEHAFLTAGYDNHVCLWSSATHKLLWRVSVEKPCLSATFSPNGALAVVGTTVGLFVALNAYDGSLVASFQVGTEQLDAIRFSPDGSLLAMGSHDNTIYLFSVLDDGRTFRKAALLKGHKNFLTHIDWSSDGRYLQSVDGDYELLFWKVDENRRENPAVTRDVTWHTQTCILGYNVLGIWPARENGIDINTVSRSESGDLLAVGDSQGFLKLYRYPSTQKKAQSHQWKMCSSNVTNVKFLYDDGYLLTTGGMDAALMQWAVQVTEGINRNRAKRY